MRMTKVSVLEGNARSSSSCIGIYDHDTSKSRPAAPGYSCHSCKDLATLCPSCCNIDERLGLDSSVAMSCQSNGGCSEVQEACSGSTLSCQDKGHSGYAYVSGWMYVNQQGQMCGPYIQQQLYDGLSTGFLPDDLPVYPIINGYMSNPVPLKYFRQFPDHVTTGFAYLQAGILPNSFASSSSTTTVPKPNGQTEHTSSAMSLNSHKEFPQNSCNGHILDQLTLNQDEADRLVAFLSSGDNHSCWSFVNKEGRNHAPHSLSELYSWHQYGYLHDSVVIHHTENKFRPITIGSLIGLWKSKCGGVNSNVTDSGVGFISEVSEGVSFQLHYGIMKTARRVLLDEIISSVISESINAKKIEASHKSEPSSSTSHVAGSRLSQASYEKEKTISLTETGVCENVTNGLEITVANQPLETYKSVGSSENYQATCAIVSKVIYDHCMDVMWNAVFYDNVAAYSSLWRKEKLWFKSPPEVMVASSSVSEEHLTCRMDSLSCKVNFSSEVEIAPKISSNSAEPSRRVILPSSDGRRGFIRGVSKSVENELFLSLKTYMTDYISGLIEQEVRKTCSSVLEGELQEANLSSSHGSSEKLAALEVSEGMKDGLRVSSGQVLPKDSKNLLQARDSSQNNMCGKTLVGIFCTAFKKSHNSVTDVNDEPDIYESPPGSEDNIEMPILPCKFKPVRSKECRSGMKEYVAMALCRQKLHDDVIRDWKSLFLERSLRQFLALWYRSRAHVTSNRAVEERKGNRELSQKKRLADAKLKTSTRKVKSVEPCSQNQSAEKPRNPKSIEKTQIKKGSKKSSIDRQPSPVVEGQRKMAKVDRRVQNKVFMKDAIQLCKDKIPNGDLDKGGDAGRQDDCDNDLLITGLKNASKNKTKALTENLIAAKTCDVKLAFTEDSEETVSTEFDNFPLKVQKANISKLKRKHLSDVKAKALASNSSKPKRKYSPNGKVSEVSKPRCKKLAMASEDTEQTADGKAQKSKLKRKLMEGRAIEAPASKALKIGSDSSRRTVSKLKSKVNKRKMSTSYPKSDGCARTSINGWEWHVWSSKASPALRARVRGSSCIHLQHLGSDSSLNQKVLSARTNRVKMRNLLAAADGADLLKISQLNARKKRLRFQRSSIHDWGLVALEPIEAEDFVIEYIGELIRSSVSDIREQKYEKMGIGSSYLFRLDDGFVVDATKRGGIARFINHSCEPNCYTKIISVDGQKRIFIYAKRHINAGEEVTYNYKFPLEENKIPCFCGAHKCRGSLN